MRLKNALPAFFCLLSLMSSSAMANFPPVMDFSKYKASIYNYFLYENESWRMGYYAFNFAPELTPFFSILKRDYQIDAAVETGTFMGGTSVALSLIFNQVHTIEVVDLTYQAAKQNLSIFPNVQCHLGSSEKVLKTLLPTLKDKRILFYLDAHWQSHWPLLEELEEISKTHKNNCIIVIDDFKIPGRPDIPYDSYGHHECSYDYIKDQLKKVLPDCTIHFLIPKSVVCRAKFVAIPKQWASKTLNP